MVSSLVAPIVCVLRIATRTMSMIKRRRISTASAFSHGLWGELVSMRMKNSCADAPLGSVAPSCVRWLDRIS